MAEAEELAPEESIMRLPFSREVVIASPLSAEVCREELTLGFTEALGLREELRHSSWSDYPVQIDWRGDTFIIKHKRSWPSRWEFRRLLLFRIETVISGCQILGQIRFPLITYPFIAFWLIVVAVSLFNAIHDAGAEGRGFGLFCLFALGFMFFRLRSAINADCELIEYVKRRVKGAVIDPP